MIAKNSGKSLLAQSIASKLPDGSNVFDFDSARQRRPLGYDGTRLDQDTVVGGMKTLGWKNRSLPDALWLVFSTNKKNGWTTVLKVSLDPRQPINIATRRMYDYNASEQTPTVRMVYGWVPFDQDVMDAISFLTEQQLSLLER